jgi:tetratricopeptide (TPR) repeat protein
VWSAPPDSSAERNRRRRSAERRAFATHAGKAAEYSGLRVPNLEAAQFHLRFIRDADIHDAWELAQRGLAFSRLGDGARAEADFAKAEAIAPSANRACLVRGEELALAGDWQKAKSYYVRGLACDSGKYSDWFKSLVIFAFDGDDALFQKHVASVFDRFGGLENVDVVGSVLWCCQLRPRAAIDPSRLLAAADRLTARKGEIRDPWTFLALGLTELRAGRFDATIAALEEGRTKLPKDRPPFWEQCMLLCRAMALHGLGQTDSARAAFNQASQPARPAHDIGGDWPKWLAYQVLNREAAGVLNAK